MISIQMVKDKSKGYHKSYYKWSTSNEINWFNAKDSWQKDKNKLTKTNKIIKTSKKKLYILSIQMSEFKVKFFRQTKTSNFSGIPV